MPWLLSLAFRRYPRHDPGTTLLWVLRMIASPDALTIRSDGAFLIATREQTVWRPWESECHVGFLCADAGFHWQAARLLRHSVTWARERGCVRWRFHSETDAGIDALAKWAGAHRDTARYVIDLEEMPDGQRH